jgi:uncharacterized RDD family membrane protein YckC
MRCPKCHYLSFDPEPRCKNCGYGFSPDDSDLLLRETSTPDGPFTDLSLHVDPNPSEPVVPEWQQVVQETSAASTGGSAAAVIDRPAVGARPQVHDPAELSIPRPAQAPRVAPTTELPLFVKGLTATAVDAAVPSPETSLSDEPIVKVPAEPRAPLGVRRQPAEGRPVRPRHSPSASAGKPGPLDRDLLSDLQKIDRPDQTDLAAGVAPASQAALERASAAGARLAAAVVDALLLAVLSAGVLWITMRWTGLSLAQVALLPVLLPIAAFLLLIALGYLLMFTAASGQTLGKMALRLRVVGHVAETGTDELLTTTQAAYRSFLTIPSVLALGAGFLPALVGDHRAVHDRLAHTRVVRV